MSETTRWTEEQAVDFFEKMLPFIKGMYQVLDEYDSEELFSVVISKDGYLTSSFHQTGWELSRLKGADEDFNLRMEYQYKPMKKIEAAVVPTAQEAKTA